MDLNSKIYIAGHNGMVGSALVRALTLKGYTNLITRSSRELDLRRQGDVEQFFSEEKPEYVFLAAAKVGGIYANQTYPAQFIYDNLMIESNIIHESYKHHVRKLLFLGSSCIYPKMAKQPIKESYLLTGPLEETNEAYAIAKIAGLKMCQFYKKQYGCPFISAMPTNLYGAAGDNFNLETAHVLPALLKKVHIAKITEKDSVVMWGTGKPRREFLHVDDLADALIFLMNTYEGMETVNIGVGSDVSLMALMTLICKIVGYKGSIVHDMTKPDGTFQKLLDVSKMTELGWQASIDLEDGIKDTYQWFSKAEN